MYTTFCGVTFCGLSFSQICVLNLWFLAIVLSYSLCLNILWMKLVQVAADLQKL